MTNVIRKHPTRVCEGAPHHCQRSHAEHQGGDPNHHELEFGLQDEAPEVPVWFRSSGSHDLGFRFYGSGRPRGRLPYRAVRGRCFLQFLRLEARAVDVYEGVEDVGVRLGDAVMVSPEGLHVLLEELLRALGLDS